MFALALSEIWQALGTEDWFLKALDEHNLLHTFTNMSLSLAHHDTAAVGLAHVAAHQELSSISPMHEQELLQWNYWKRDKNCFSLKVLQSWRFVQSAPQAVDRT